jgi:hypothetical protein
MPDLETYVARRMIDIPREDWDTLADPAGTPLLSWGFLALLEESGSVLPETGWTPAHVLLRDRRDGTLAAAAPFYVRGDSWGEFVFDQGFARAAERAGYRWYPKLSGVVPVTPAPAWRVLTAPGGGKPEGSADAASPAARLLDAAESLAREGGLAGVHVLWPDDPSAGFLRSRPGWSAWEHQAFLWSDEGFGDFRGWLDSFSKNMRRNVLRERAALAASGVTTRVVDAREAAADPGLLALMADLYAAHNDRFGPWAAKFLTRDFFLRLPEFLPGGWILCRAERGGRTVGLSFLFEGRDRLYGRYYGASEEIPFLHFELCYYLPVEYALSRGIRSFDPGMGGEHKARRGFRSYTTPSFHRPLAAPLVRFLKSILPDLGREEEAAAAALNGELPYKG